MISIYYGTHNSVKLGIQLKSAKKGTIQLRVSVTPLDSRDPVASKKLASASRLGLITARLQNVSGLCPSPEAIRLLGASVWSRGDYELKLVTSFGLKQYKARGVAGVAVPVLPWAGVSAEPAVPAATSGPSVLLNQDCKMWLHEAERNYVMQLNLYAQARGAPRMVLVGRGFAPIAHLSDGKSHHYLLHLRSGAVKDSELTDADQGALLKRGDSSRDLLREDSSGDGFRDVTKRQLENTSVRGLSGTPADGPEHPGVAAATIGNDAVVDHVVGLEPELPGYVTGCLSLQLAFSPSDQLESWFFNKLLAEFDTDRSGVLDAAEFCAMLHMLGVNMAAQEMDALIKRIDKTGTGKLAAPDIVQWFQSHEFQTLPLAYSLLSFLADGKAGLDKMVNDVGASVHSSGKLTGDGAAILSLNEGDHEVLAESGLKIFDRKTGLVLNEQSAYGCSVATGRSRERRHGPASEWRLRGVRMSCIP